MKNESNVVSGLGEVEPWEQPVAGANLLDELAKTLRRFVVLPKWAAETFALWILHTYAFWLREVTTYVGIESPEKECGKSTLLTALSQFVSRPALSSNISASAFFRVIEDLQPTLLIDEADTNLRGRDDLRGILNAGYTKPTAFVWRIRYEAALAPEEDAPPALASDAPGATGPDELPHEGKPSVPASGKAAARVVRYSCWCPKAIAAIGRLHPTLASRCIVVRMQRKTAAEECERLKRLDATDLKRKCARYVADHAAKIAAAEPPIPPALTNRAADVWEPLFALADLAGGRWPDLAREAAIALTASAHERSPIGSLLLDIMLSFVSLNRDRLFSRELVAALTNSGDRPWLELTRGKPVTEGWVAQQLRPYAIRPKTIRIGDDLAKGYLQDDFQDTFRRYIPKSEVEGLKADLAAKTNPTLAPDTTLEQSRSPA